MCVNTGNEDFIPAERVNLLSLDGSGPLLPLIAFDLLLSPREQQPTSVFNWGIEAAMPPGGNAVNKRVDMGCYERVEADAGNEGGGCR